MKKIQKISSRIIIALAILWAVAVVAGLFPSLGWSYLGIGFLSAYIGIQNIILLVYGQRTGDMPEKIAYLINRHGNDKGMVQYVLVNIMLYLFIGLIVMYRGWTML